MISEIERGFNYTLTRDKLAMNLGSPPRKPKNVVQQGKNVYDQEKECKRKKMRTERYQEG